MHDKLRQFERESKLEIFGLGARREIWERALEKYAELIVRECSKIAEEYDGAKLSGPGMIIAARIETHFGVEE